MQPSFRALVAGDEPAVEAFLAARPDTTMILRSNLARAGITYRGAPFEGTYVGAFEGDALAGVAAQYWNGNIVLAGGAHAAELARRTADLTGRPVAGLLGTWSDVEEARRALGIERARHVGKEVLFSLELADLVVPPALASGEVSAGTPTEADMPMLLEWRMAYSAETMSQPDTPETRRAEEELLRVLHDKGDDVLLRARDEPVAYSAFNATLPDIVQVGGVYTPPELRRRGYARCAVAVSLLRKRDEGATRAILFTAEDNLAAQKSYLALGFRQAGDYAIVLVD